MQMEARVDGDGVQVCMRIHPSRTLTLVGLRCGLPHLPSPSLLLSPSFPPSPAPSPPHLPPRPRDTGVGLTWYGTCSLQVAAIRIRTRTLTEMEKHRCPCEHLLSLTVVLVIPSSCAAGAVHTRYARDVDIEAGVCVYGKCLTLVLTFARVIVRSKRGIRAYRCWCRFLLPTRIPRAHAPQIWVYFCVWMRTGALRR
jgi:hypothetical protein